MPCSVSITQAAACAGRVLSRGGRLLLREATLLAALAAAAAASAQTRSLEELGARLDLDRGAISISGLSSGGYMAQQFHVAHAAHVMGVAILAGGPYRCAAGVYPPYSWFDASGLYAATSRCSNTNPYWIYQGPPDLEASLRATRTEAAAGAIDDPHGMRGDRVWLFSGGQDDTVPPGVVEVLERYYQQFVDAADIQHERIEGAGHAMITEDRGDTCGASAPPFVNDCDFDAAGSLLRHLYGELRRPAAHDQVTAPLAFDQSMFFARDDASVSLHATGYLYVPDRCLHGARCRLHVAFHGCRQQHEQVGDAFVAGAGYNRWAQSNGIVVLYPQTIAWGGGVFGSDANPRGCWDWWGYSGSAYHRKDGKQIRAVAAMINALLGAEVLALELRER